MIKDIPVAALKYVPNRQSSPSYAHAAKPVQAAIASDGLPLPPAELIRGYADSEAVYLSSGALQVDRMLGLVGESGLDFTPTARLLDFGCGIGRMVRRLKKWTETGEVWGVDISAPHIAWCRQYLSPPFRFATTTTLPHLPFPDRYFDLVFAGSVFTHIDDLAEAWLLELRRVTRPGGRTYITIHDESTIEQLEGPFRNCYLTRQLKEDPSYLEAATEFGMLVIGRDTGSQVFYARGYFDRMAASCFSILSVTPMAHGYQTAYVLSPRWPA